MADYMHMGLRIREVLEDIGRVRPKEQDESKFAELSEKLACLEISITNKMFVSTKQQNAINSMIHQAEDMLVKYE